MRTRFSNNVRTIVTKRFHEIFSFRNPSKISTSSHVKSRMYQGLPDTWHGSCSGEGNEYGYPCHVTSSWPEVLPWSREIWPRTIQWRRKGEETSLRVFALWRGSKDMYRYVRCTVPYIAVLIILVMNSHLVWRRHTSKTLSLSPLIEYCWLQIRTLLNSYNSVTSTEGCPA